MCDISDTTGSDSESEVDVDYFDPATAIGWHDSTELDRYLKHSPDKIKKLIGDANRLQPLSEIIFSYGVKWQVTENQSGWTHKSCCPFSDHRDDAPSFGYNSKDQRFHCFGCNRSGGTVQFRAFIEHRSAVDIAKEIVCRRRETDQVVSDLQEEIRDVQNDKINASLQEFSIYVRQFIHRNKKDVQFVEKLTWCLDVYLEKHNLDMSFESIVTRIEKLKQKLTQYEQNINSR